MSFDRSQFYAVFVEECFEALDTMETHLLKLEAGEADLECIYTIFRSAHSIKGGAGTFGFTAMAGFTHVLETLLDQMREGERSVSDEAVTLLLGSVDVLRAMVAEVQGGEPANPTEAAELSVLLEALLDGDTGAREPAPSDEKPAVSGVWTIDFRPAPHMLRSGNDPIRMFRELGRLGALRTEVRLDDLPALEDVDPELAYLGWSLCLEGAIARASIDEVFEWVEGDCTLEITSNGGSGDEFESSAGEETAAADSIEAEPVVLPMSLPPLVTLSDSSGSAVAASAKPEEGRATKARSVGRENSSIRVGIDKVDSLMNMVGQLVITQSMLGQLGGIQDFGVDEVQRLRDGLAQLERNTRELQESVMRIRMLPISSVFNRFPRLVHDLSAKLGKKVEMKVSGEGTELDKTVMEKIGDPLVHLVRNCLDHGIERPEVRCAANKPEAGTVQLDAYREGGNIVIEISDDGAGLCREKIVGKARERGLIAEGESVPDDRVADLVFLPGFSTADEVSDISGRGVGMDVVKRNLTQRVLEAVQMARTPDEAAKAALDAIRDSLGWAYGSYWRLDSHAGVLRFATESGAVNAEFRRVTEITTFAEGVGLCGRAWQSRDLFFVADIGEMQDCIRAPVAQRAGVKSGVCFPVMIAGEVIGTIDCFALETIDMPQQRIEALRGVGRLVSNAVEHHNGVARLQSAVDGARTAMMMVDRDLVVTYVNAATLELLRAHESELRQVYPGFDASRIVGTCIDRFHRDPAHQRAAGRRAQSALLDRHRGGFADVQYQRRRDARRQRQQHRLLARVVRRDDRAGTGAKSRHAQFGRRGPRDQLDNVRPRRRHHIPQSRAAANAGRQRSRSAQSPACF